MLSSRYLRSLSKLSLKSTSLQNYSKPSFLTPISSSFSSYNPDKVKNVAIIAHVDHGKTTLMDKLLEHCGTSISFERAMDSNEHEKERGITIMSKYTRLYYKEHTLHVVDTPGHADFGGEVERILAMVDGVVLLVDASEGPMSQTKFVLSKALAANKKSIVVLNKVDREGHRAQEVEDEIMELYFALTNKEDLLEYPLLYASARQGWVTTSLKDVPGKHGVIPLLDAIIAAIPSSTTPAMLTQPFAMSVNTIQADAHLGRIVTGKVETGVIKIGDRIKVLPAKNNVNSLVTNVNNNNLNNNNSSSSNNSFKVTKLFFLEGLQRVDVESASAGEIVSLAGCNEAASVTDTVCSVDCIDSLTAVPISPPIISMTFGPNDSPLSGREGNKVTSSMIKDRIRKEIENNVTLSIKPSSDPEAIDVQGRGELQIGILVESMRREGFELTISPPKVLMSYNQETKEQEEPIEEVSVDIDTDLQGIVIDAMSNRQGKMLDMKDIGGIRSRLIFSVPSRGMMGFRYEILTATRGNATVNSIFSHYSPMDKSSAAQASQLSLKKGKLVSMETGKSTGYSLMSVEERGTLYIAPSEDVYEGMVIGENAKAGDLDVNPCKSKKLTNMRSTGAEEKVTLSPPKKMSVEQVMANVDEDEVIEVTPKNIRLRKRILDSGARARHVKQQKYMKEHGNK